MKWIQNELGFCFKLCLNWPLRRTVLSWGDNTWLTEVLVQSRQIEPPGVDLYREDGRDTVRSQESRSAPNLCFQCCDVCTRFSRHISQKPGRHAVVRVSSPPDWLSPHEESRCGMLQEGEEHWIKYGIWRKIYNSWKGLPPHRLVTSVPQLLSMTQHFLAVPIRRWSWCLLEASLLSTSWSETPPNSPRGLPSFGLCSLSPSLPSAVSQLCTTDMVASL